jgi:hypothetical protein
VRTRIPAAGLVPLLLLLMAAAACSKPNDGDGVASAGGTAAPSLTPSLSKLDQMINYTRCMREHGVPMDDPVVQGDNVNPGRIDKGAAGDKLFPADDACKHLRPAPEAGPQLDFKNELARRFAQCMRAHGVENFPDPAADGSGTQVSAEVGADPQFQEARETCKAQSDAEFRSGAPSAGTR